MSIATYRAIRDIIKVSKNSKSLMVHDTESVDRHLGCAAIKLYRDILLKDRNEIDALASISEMVFESCTYITGEKVTFDGDTRLIVEITIRDQPRKMVIVQTGDPFPEVASSQIEHLVDVLEIIDYIAYLHISRES